MREADGEALLRVPSRTASGLAAAQRWERIAPVFLEARPASSEFPPIDARREVRLSEAQRHPADQVQRPHRRADARYRLTVPGIPVSVPVPPRLESGEANVIRLPVA